MGIRWSLLAAGPRKAVCSSSLASEPGVGQTWIKILAVHYVAFDCMVIT